MFITIIASRHVASPYVVLLPPSSLYESNSNLDQSPCRRNVHRPVPRRAILLPRTDGQTYEISSPGLFFPLCDRVQHLSFFFVAAEARPRSGRKPTRKKPVSLRLWLVSDDLSSRELPGARRSRTDLILSVTPATKFRCLLPRRADGSISYLSSIFIFFFSNYEFHV